MDKSRRQISYGRQDISDQDIQAVLDVLRSDRLTQGPAIEEFEAAVAKYCGSKYAVAVANGTAALHLACLALKLDSKQSLWTSPNSFVASANCALYCGASVDFVDIELDTYNMSPDYLEEKLQKSKGQGKIPNILIPVHISGRSCDMKRIRDICNKYDISIIEDASHALGAQYNGSKVGCCEYSEMATLSFHPVKSITTGEGGMVLTNDKELFERLNILRSHGITRKDDFFKGERAGPWYYEQIELGFNYRITDIQAALGTSQMKRLDQFIQLRRDIARRYTDLLSPLPLTLPDFEKSADSAWHLFVPLLPVAKQNQSQRKVSEYLHSEGIYVNLHYIPIHSQPFYQELGFRNGDFPRAEEYYSRAISLPIHTAITAEDQAYIAQKLEKAITLAY